MSRPVDPQLRIATRAQAERFDKAFLTGDMYQPFADKEGVDEGNLDFFVDYRGYAVHVSEQRRPGTCSDSRFTLTFEKGDALYTIETSLKSCRNSIGALFLFDIDNDGITDIVFKEHSGDSDMQDRLLVLRGE